MKSYLTTFFYTIVYYKLPYTHIITMVSLYEDYESYIVKYQKEYGQHTIVLYRCGSFYEIYSADDGLVDIRKIADLLNIQVSRRNKSIVEVNRSNTLMAGFPMYVLQKFIGILTQANYTVVVVDQVSDPPKPKRAVTMVVSPGTNIDVISSPDSNTLMSIYIDEYGEHLMFGVASIDLTTGNSKVWEIAPLRPSEPYDTSIGYDKLITIIQQDNPKEIVLFGKVSATNSKLSFVINQIQKMENRCVLNKINDFDGNVCKVAYQNTFLEKVYPKHGILSIIEYLGLECHLLALVSFVYVIQFSYQHNENIIKSIQRPIIVCDENKVSLSSNCLRHLDVVSRREGEGGSLLSLLNTCCTAFGKRKFREMLLDPSKDINVLQQRFDGIDFFIQDKKYKQFQKYLSEIYDLERLSRKITLQKIQPADFMQVYESMTAAHEIFKMLPNDMVPCPQWNSGCNDVLDFIKSNLSLTEIVKYHRDNIDDSFIVKGCDMEIDNHVQELGRLMGWFQSLVEHLNEMAGIDYFKLENNQMDGYFLSITSKRWSDFKKNKGYNTFLFRDGNVCKGVAFTLHDCHIVSKTTSLKVTHESFKVVNSNIQNVQTKLKERVLQYFIDFVDTFHVKFHGFLELCIYSIGVCDVHVANAKNAFERRYVRPLIKEEGSAFIKATNMRHAIIETLCNNEKEPYVPNDVDLCSKRGMLLYGTNMVGKSAYMKSIGLCVMMAQAGMYVPCDTMEFHPFDAIFTRIPTGDDLFKGQSTFATEISDLRGILKRSTKNSLVIGDELASGTESISAVSIVAAGISQLSEKHVVYVFATHLHDLVKIPAISKNDNLRICHMTVSYDHEKKVLVYDRKLKDGQGSTIYGLEVCKALDMGDEFMKLANSYRQQLMEIPENIVITKTSRYNAAVYVDVCGVCGARADEVHHIQHQQHANGDGYIGHIHKNAKHNLVPLCTKCHDKVHSGEMTIEGYKLTSEGVVLSTTQEKKEDNTDDGELKQLQIRAKALRAEGVSYQKISKDLGITIYKIKKLTS